MSGMPDQPVALIDSRGIKPTIDRLYMAIAHAIRCALADADVEHIGATSIEGLLTKGDLDILVAVKRERFHEAMDTLRSYGWSKQDDSFSCDELQPMKHDGFGEDVAVQLIVKGSTFEFFRRFRYDLAASAELRRKYNRIKRSAAAAGMEEYRRSKSE
jgi:GrpB-like predicted nucleotidyltransferase (UPF0157 family)